MAVRMVIGHLLAAIVKAFKNCTSQAGHNLHNLRTKENKFACRFCEARRAVVNGQEIQFFTGMYDAYQDGARTS